MNLKVYNKNKYDIISKHFMFCKYMKTSKACKKCDFKTPCTFLYELLIKYNDYDRAINRLVFEQKRSKNKIKNKIKLINLQNKKK